MKEIHMNDSAESSDVRGPIEVIERSPLIRGDDAETYARVAERMSKQPRFQPNTMVG
jgi:hypothetical protein